MPNLLNGRMAYLSGPIEFDSGANWRVEPTALLESLGVTVFDPFSDPKQQWVPVLKEARERNDVATIRRIAKSFVRKDLAMVDRSDFVVGYLPYRVPTTGTHHELISANGQKKPTLLVTNRDTISDIPVWYYGFVSPEFMFAGWGALGKYLEEVDAGGHLANDRWQVATGQI